MRCWAGPALAAVLVAGAGAAAHTSGHLAAATDPELPTRVLDTRRGAGPLMREQVRRLVLPTELVPAGAAVALNLTGDRAAGPGWISVWSCAHPRPATSILNVVPGHPVANMVALADVAGGVCFTASTTVDLIVDLTAVMEAGDYGGSAPQRLLDTRNGAAIPAREEVALDISGITGIPGDATGAALNVTVVSRDQPGWLAVAPCGAAPGSSTVNFGPHEVVPHFTFTRVTGARTCLTSSTPVDVVVDAFGWIPAGSSLDPIDPERALDTRIGSRQGAVADGDTVRVRIAGYGSVPNSAAGVTVNVVVVHSGALGHLTAWPCGSNEPQSSTVNVWPGATRANQATLGLSAEGELCLRPRLADGSSMHVVIDVVGVVAGRVDRPAPPPTTTPPTTVAGSGRFATLPVGAELPSGAECAARVRPAPEIRPDNSGPNSVRGSGPNTSPDWPGFRRVDGNFTGTTDEIIQWAACKWGIDEDMVRAQVVKESYWHQWAVGDNGESFGLGQVRVPYHGSAFPDAANSSAYNLDYTYAVWRYCYEGDVAWLNDVERGREYGAGDAWGCMGVWFSGRWYTADAIAYIEGGGSLGAGNIGVRQHLAARTWEAPEFVNHR
ncbi:MAG TPA: hypothetical protein VNQ73_05440 [Ilumatobacter sp.]|nr:hypothetical protein [Ilumatobacter sp.]